MHVLKKFHKKIFSLTAFIKSFLNRFLRFLCVIPRFLNKFEKNDQKLFCVLFPLFLFVIPLHPIKAYYPC